MRVNAEKSQCACSLLAQCAIACIMLGEEKDTQTYEYFDFPPSGIIKDATGVCCKVQLAHCAPSTNSHTISHHFIISHLTTI
jgi:hypothetical protein